MSGRGWVARAMVLAGLAAAALSAMPAQAESLWLLIGASDTSAAAIAKKARALGAKQPAGLVLQTRDCGEAKNVYAWTAGVFRSADAAQAALPQVRAFAPEASVRRCEVRPGSLLAWRVNAVDPSIAEVPPSAAGWRDEDRVSTVVALEGAPAGARSLLVTRYFADAPNDPFEGRRERLSLVDAAGRQTLLDSHCLSAGRVVVDRDAFALQCVREQAADEWLHTVLAFDAAGRRLGEVARCRNPRLPDAAGGARQLSCEAESLDATGRLQLRRTTVTLR